MIGMCSVLVSCSQKNESNDSKVSNTSLKPGTIVVADSMSVLEDQLNNTMFSVKVIANENTPKGKYTVKAAWGYNEAESELAMPKGGEKFIPMLRKEAIPYTYSIGFQVKGDTTFYDYYLVNADKGTIRMKYIKAYSFE